MNNKNALREKRAFSVFEDIWFHAQGEAFGRELDSLFDSYRLTHTVIGKPSPVVNGQLCNFYSKSAKNVVN